MSEFAIREIEEYGMQRQLSLYRPGNRGPSLLRATLVLCLLAAAVGCEARGVGDPCIPESIPAGGFDAREVYIETSAVQCRTRACIVFEFEGNPECQFNEAGQCPPQCTSGCRDPADVLEAVHCTCRCSDGGGDSNVPLCTCNDGFHCVDVLMAGGDGVRGGYCVRNEADDLYCVTDDDCTSGSCVNNRCPG